MSKFFAAARLIIIGALVLIVGAYLLVNIGATIAAAHKRSVVKSDLTTRLASAVPAARAHQADVRAAGATLGAPQVSWIAQDCDFPTSDAGWMVQSYRQACALTAVTAWRVESESAARAAAGAFPEALVGPPPSADDYVGTDCVTLAEATLGERREVALVLVKPRGDASYWCGDLYQPGYMHRLVDGSDQPLEPTGTWLVARSREQLNDVDLGCTHWTVLFCGNPFGDKPAYGEPPAAP